MSAFSLSQFCSTVTVDCSFTCVISKKKKKTESQLLLEYSLFDLLLGFSSRSACRYRPLLPRMPPSFQTCCHDTREECRSSHHDFLHFAFPLKRILDPIAGLASRLFERLSVSLSFSSRYRRRCLPFTFSSSLVINGWFEARYSCVLRSFR